MHVLQHTHVLGSEDEDIKLIGVYSTEEKAKKTIVKLSSQPGFKKSQNGFSIDKYEIDKDHWCEGYITAESE